MKPAGKVKTFAVKRYMSFVDKYMDKFENRFEKKYPKAFKIYKLFKDGEPPYICIYPRMYTFFYYYNHFVRVR